MKRMGGGRTRLDKREKLSCYTVSTETSGDLSESFEAEKTIQSCPQFGQGDWACRPPCWFIDGCKPHP